MLHVSTPYIKVQNKQYHFVADKTIDLTRTLLRCIRKKEILKTFEIQGTLPNNVEEFVKIFNESNSLKS